MKNVVVVVVAMVVVAVAITANMSRCYKAGLKQKSSCSILLISPFPILSFSLKRMSLCIIFDLKLMLRYLFNLYHIDELEVGDAF